MRAAAVFLIVLVPATFLVVALVQWVTRWLTDTGRIVGTERPMHLCVWNPTDPSARRDISEEADLATPLARLAYPRLFSALEQCYREFSKIPALSAVGQDFRRLAVDSAKPLMVVVMGQFKAGKSTLLNALLMEEVLVSDVTPATAAVTELRYAEPPLLRAHFRNNQCCTYPVSELAALSAEGHPDGVELRRNLRYLELGIPNPELQRITLVDTPGLNSNNDLHTEATRSFMDRADAVLWVFSYSQAGTATEAVELKNLPSDCCTLAVVNQIDQHDPEEESLDAALNRIKRRLGGTIHAIAGVSARLALAAHNTGDAQALAQSGWNAFIEILDREIIEQGSQRKGIRIASRLCQALQKLRAIVDQADQEVAKAQRVFSLGEKYVRALTLQRHDLVCVQKAWQVAPGATARVQRQFSFRGGKFQEIAPVPTSEAAATHLGGQRCSGGGSGWNFNSLVAKEAEGYILNKPAAKVVWEAPALETSVEGAEKLNRQRELLRGVLASLVTEADKLNKEIEAHNQREQEVIRRFEEHNADAARYNTSSILGGPPILGSLLDGGWGERINRRWERLQRLAQEIDAEVERLNSSQQALQSRMERAEVESHGFVDHVRAAIDRSIAKLDAEAWDRKGTEARAQKQIDDHRWVRGVRQVLEGGLLPGLIAGVNEIMIDVDISDRDPVHLRPLALMAVLEELEHWKGSSSSRTSHAVEQEDTQQASTRPQTGSVPVRHPGGTAPACTSGCDRKALGLHHLDAARTVSAVMELPRVKSPLARGRPTSPAAASQNPGPHVAGLHGYCVKCRAKKKIKDPKQITIKGRAATQGVCPDCGTMVVRWCGQKVGK